jgi:PST family polysaccharide transporter
VLLFWANHFIKSGLNRINYSITNIKKRLRENFALFLSSTFTHLTLNSALIVLSFFATNRELGRFTLSYKVAFFIRMVPVFFIQSSLQKATNLYRSSIKDYNDYISKYYFRGIIVNFILVLGIFFSSDFIIKIFSDEKIEYSSNILSILSFIPLLAMLNFKNIVYILINDFKDLLNKATFYTLIFLLFSSVILSFFYSGYGLAIALIFTEIFSFLIHSILLSNAR